MMCAATFDKNPPEWTRSLRGCLGAPYWQARIDATLDPLETEARRMLQLEQELSEFSACYYAAIGDAAERLAALEAHPAVGVACAPETVMTLPEMLIPRDVQQQRRREMKTRYRTLAKEVHPDGGGAMAVAEDTGARMHQLTHAYQQGDLAALLRLEASVELTRLLQEMDGDPAALEQALREVVRATATYAEGYRSLLHSPLNELMLRAMSARLAGWDWVQAVVRKMERSIAEKERALAQAHIAEISAWRMAMPLAA